MGGIKLYLESLTFVEARRLWVESVLETERAAKRDCLSIVDESVSRVESGVNAG